MTGLSSPPIYSDWLAGLTIEHLLVIIDACFAGQVTEQIQGLASTRRHWLVLPSATKGQKAQLSALTSAISKFMAEGRKYNTEDPYYRVGMFVRSLNELLAPDQQVEKIYKGEDHDEHACLPNPSCPAGHQSGDHCRPPGAGAAEGRTRTP